MDRQFSSFSTVPIRTAVFYIGELFLTHPCRAVKLAIKMTLNSWVDLPAATCTSPQFYYKDYARYPRVPRQGQIAALMQNFVPALHYVTPEFSADQYHLLDELLTSVQVTKNYFSPAEIDLRVAAVCAPKRAVNPEGLYVPENTMKSATGVGASVVLHPQPSKSILKGSSLRPPATVPQGFRGVRNDPAAFLRAPAADEQPLTPHFAATAERGSATQQ